LCCMNLLFESLMVIASSSLILILLELLLVELLSGHSDVFPRIVLKLLALYFHFTCPHPEINFRTGNFYPAGIMLAFLAPPPKKKKKKKTERMAWLRPSSMASLALILHPSSTAFPSLYTVRDFFFSWVNSPFLVGSIHPPIVVKCLEV